MKAVAYIRPLAMYLLVLLLLPGTLAAHHGWGWATSEEFEITGEIVDSHWQFSGFPSVY